MLVFFTCFHLYEHVWKSQLVKGCCFTAFSRPANFSNFVPLVYHPLQANFCIIVMLGVGYASLKWPQ